MKYYALLILIALCPLSLLAQPEKDYNKYHLGIINAEEAIFIRNDSIRGLQLFKSTFEGYDFVFVDDCIEAFQLALYFKRNDMAMAFIKKAIENGFEIKLLNLLSLGCPCNNYTNMRTKVCIQDSFIAKNKTYLETYAASTYRHYLSRINKDIVINEIKRHVKEQLFKNDHPELGLTTAQQDKEYDKICDDNLRYIDSLGLKHTFPGERNMGIYTQKLADSLHLPFKSIEKYARNEISTYRLPPDTRIPYHTQADYFEKSIVYNMLFHNKKSFDTISKYKDEAIRLGYMHPREYASLFFYVNINYPKNEIALAVAKDRIAETHAINAKRKQLLLPSYEIDYAKHAFAHAHDLQLTFGMFNGTR